MQYNTLDKADLSGKRVLLRAGFDLPMEEGKVVDTSRVEAILPTMKEIIRAGASLIIMSHQGRPKGERVPEFSQKPVVSILEKMLDTSVMFAEHCTGEETLVMAQAMNPGDVMLLENLRYEKGEKSKDEAERDAFGKDLAALADVYVNDAFPNCHRAHASMTSVPKFLPAYMGLHLQEEVEQLSKVLDDPRHPVVLIVSGAKMETKVPVIEQFLDKGDDVLVGGCIANTFIAARGFDVGKSKYETEQIEKARELMLEGEKVDLADIHVPRDAVVASEISDTAECADLPLEDIGGDMAIFDIGKVTVERYKEAIAKAGTIVWNGPLGVYEYEQFANGTKEIAKAVVAATERGVVTLLGGGDTIDFHTRYGLPMNKYTFVSTGGGAMLEFVSGKELPALKILEY